MPKGKNLERYKLSLNRHDFPEKYQEKLGRMIGKIQGEIMQEKTLIKDHLDKLNKTIIPC